MDDIITTKKKLSTKLSILVNSFSQSIVNTHCYLCGSAHSSKFAICQPCYRDLPWITEACLRCGSPITHEALSPSMAMHSLRDQLKSPHVILHALTLGRQHQSNCRTCAHENFAFDRCVALFRYAFPIPEIIHQYKYDKKRYWRRPLGQLLLHHGQHFKQQYYASNDYPLPDMVIPVPTTLNKLRTREFNQASELAAYIGQLFSIRVEKNIVKRTDNGPAQAQLNLKQRQTTLRDAYTPGNHIAKVQDKNLLIVDDVVTSGNTVHYLAKLLKGNGARHVEVWTLARTPKKG